MKARETDEKDNKIDKEKNLERFENMTNSELITLMQRAPALRDQAEVARAANWVKRKSDTLRNLELRMYTSNWYLNSSSKIIN